MKTFRPAALLFLLLLLVACGKIELEGIDPPDDPKDEQSETPDGGDDDEPAADYLTVADLSLEEDDAYVEVAGYIVGYVTGRTMSAAVFGAEGAVASNLVIADTPGETDPQRCAPVQLESGTEIREVLNLADNPENLGAYVLFYGYKNKYFGTAGIKSLEDYEFLDGEEPEDEEPVPAQTFPTLSDEAAQVLDGC